MMKEGKAQPFKLFLSLRGQAADKLQAKKKKKCQGYCQGQSLGVFFSPKERKGGLYNGAIIAAQVALGRVFRLLRPWRGVMFV